MLVHFSEDEEAGTLSTFTEYGNQTVRNELSAVSG